MKCPYKNFEDCIVEKCPACNYETIKETVVEGRYPHYMSAKTAIERGNAWETTRTKYKFVSCNLVNNCVQPVLRDEHIVNNNIEIDMLMHHSIF